MDDEQIFRLLSAVSAVSSLTVVLTGIIFPKLILATTHPFSHMIFFISLCDSMASFAFCIGFPENTTTACPVQAGFLIYFVSASWVWTAMLVFNLRCLLICKKLWLRLSQSHLICWSIPLVTTLLPLTDTKFGQDDDLSGHAPCIYGGSGVTSNIWTHVTFNGLAVTCFIIMSLSMISVAWHFKADGIAAHKREYEIYKTTRLYPLGLFITWIPLVILNYFRFGEVSLFFEIALNIQTQFGTILAIIFYSSSPRVRKAWTVFCCRDERLSVVSDRFSSARDSSSDIEDREDMIEERRSSYNDTKAISKVDSAANTDVSASNRHHGDTNSPTKASKNPLMFHSHGLGQSSTDTYQVRLLF